MPGFAPFTGPAEKWDRQGGVQWWGLSLLLNGDAHTVWPAVPQPPLLTRLGNALALWFRNRSKNFGP
ncbi:protein of unknown function [Candidatus Hydrogenisulfobacillus filiaventi]|uniref:Uncharacterized protein n=1 Tax=Candidatus Hydrogenisulfobacillus filiaventi TaxID=2707344 RepID=A0A6F8ZCZ6_9FIRM|nr:protein of unknown function [Candidatus Hydrogenisulfobacillus filiaventi]